ncbi:ATPase, T2SS/T4P/T4SS family [Microbacterium kribbense]|uniref:ATPase, T2SS/T4P/T4SS family n=1 Tax=Microbacterium kribbense TaxID=433645 RepID=A0ABP7GJC2_9MICO
MSIAHAAGGGAAARGLGGRPDPVRAVAERVRDRLRDEQSDPARDPDRAAQIAWTEVRRHNDYALARGLEPIDDEHGCVREVLASVSGYGPLQAYLDDPTVEELWINSPSQIFVARAGASERVPLVLTDAAVRDLVERMLQATGRRVDLSQPFVDAALPDGSRLHVVIPDITRRHWSVNVRKFLTAHRTLAGLVDGGSLTRGGAGLLRDAVRDGASIIVSGATHAGKTTLLGALIGESAPGTRVVTVEETFELALDVPDVVALQGRQPSLEGTGEVTLRRLVKEALRMRPDRLVVGEVRDAEALDLVLALNTGVPGAATVHANSARDALVKLAALPLLAARNIDAGFVLPAIASSVDLVAHCVREPDGTRRVAEVVAPTGGVVDGVIDVRTVYESSDRRRRSSAS